MSAAVTARITGMGSYVPSRILSNEDLEKMVETSDEWILTRTGMRERRIADKDEHPSTMGEKAARIALEKAGINASAIDLILVTTMTPDYICPSTATVIQHHIGAANAAAFDVSSACSGYLYGLSIAKAYIESGMYRNVMVIATEKMSAYVDYEDRSTCVLFGDGASAIVVSNKGKGLLLDYVSIGADGSLGQALIIPGSGACNPATSETVENRDHYIKMSGREIFKHAVKRMSQAAVQCLEEASCTKDEISWFIPHQANTRIIDAIAKQLELPEEKVCLTIHKYGNTSASSIGIALDELQKEGKIQHKQKLLLLAFGGGLTWGAALLTAESGT